MRVLKRYVHSCLLTVAPSLPYSSEGKTYHTYTNPPQDFITQALYHFKTVYLLTASDLKTTLLPASIFALVSTLSGPLLTTTSSTPLPRLSLHFPLLKSLLWIYLNLLLFNLSNQRLPSSILEDSINKPWRAIPSRRLSPTSARRLLLLLIAIVILLSTLYLGARNETLFLIVLTYIYNDLGAGDENFLLRHVNNAFGFITFGAGAAQVALCSSGKSLNSQAYIWLGVIATIITFTIQFQDMEDQEGDRKRERRTLPIVLGDLWMRRMNAVVIIVFSIAAPAFWRLGCLGYSVPVGMGLLIAGRSLVCKPLQDKTTFQLWCLWLVILYLLPLAKGDGALAGPQRN